MIREIDEKLIVPEKLLSSSDMARLGCGGCNGCSDCCRDRAEMITLDPVDIRLLKEHFGTSFEGLLEAGYITLSVVDGVVLPGLSKKQTEDACIFLNDDGRCHIHPLRPGICRMFPLARLYHEDGSFSYFVQEGECSKATGVKIKISKWLGYPDIRSYEAQVRAYHDALVKLRGLMQNDPPQQEQVRLQRAFLAKWFEM